MSATSSISGRSNVARARVEDLSERETQLLTALQEVRAALRQARTELQDAESARERVTKPKSRTAFSEATFRRVARELGIFTVSELAAELGCPKPTATRHLKTMLDIEMVRPAGRVMGKAVYEHVKPTEPGEAFVAQREQRRHLAAVPETTRVQPVAGTGRGMVIGDKDVQQACDEAQRRGWKLQRKGDGHYVLVKGARRVPVPSTPRSSTEAADRIRRMTRERT